jgi:glycosyltransferase involved in cell wall biosynthesis
LPDPTGRRRAALAVDRGADIVTTPLVSICIPAFRGRWLDAAIASALAQTFRDVEIVISDDSAGEEIATIVCKWDDPRIRYLRNPNRGLIGTNRDNLIRNSKGRYLKFLFDDDMLMPNSVELLLGILERSKAGLAFHSRHVIDEEGRLQRSPQFPQTQETIEIRPADFFRILVARCINVIGEPSNILLDTAALRSIPFAYTIQERRMGFLSDVALYTNFQHRALGVFGTGIFGSAFRVHPEQTSGEGFAGFSAGLFEWELLRRWAVDHLHLDAETFDAGQEVQTRLYAKFVARFPELVNFMKIGGRRSSGHFLSDEFRRALDLAYSTIALRQFSRSQSVR